VTAAPARDTYTENSTPAAKILPRFDSNMHKVALLQVIRGSPSFNQASARRVQEDSGKRLPADKLSSKRRSEIARKAAAARWEKAKKS